MKNIYEMMSMLINDGIPGRKLISEMSSEQEINNAIQEIENTYSNTALFNFLDESKDNDWRVGLVTRDSEDGTTLIGKAYVHDATT